MTRRSSQIDAMADISAILKALCDSKHIERERAKGKLEILIKQTSKTKMDVWAGLSSLTSPSMQISPTPSGLSTEAELEAKLSALEDGALNMLQSVAWESRMGGLVVLKVTQRNPGLTVLLNGHSSMTHTR